MDANTGVALQAKLAGRVAQYADRREDWSGFGFGTGLDPRYARRSAGASGSVDPSDLRGATPGDRLHDVDPVDAGGQPDPVHYYGTEEVFFMFDGECLVRCWDGEET